MVGSEKFLGKKWRVLVGTVALGAASIGITAAALPSSAATTGGTSSMSGTTTVVECRSAVVTNGDVSTSSAFAARVPAGVQLPDTIPGDCVVTNG